MYKPRDFVVYMVRHVPTGLFATGELEPDRMYTDGRGRVWLDEPAAAAFAGELANLAKLRCHQHPRLEVVAFDLTEQQLKE